MREEDLRAGRLRASLVYRYLSTALFSLTPVRMPGLGTFAVGKNWHLYWDDRLSWSVYQIAEVLAHEVWHLLRRHYQRAEVMGVTVKTEDVAQIAMDCEINDTLDLSRMPWEPLLPEQFGLERNLLWEDYYNQLLSQKTPTMEHMGVPKSGSCSTGIPAPWEKEGSAISEVRSELVRRQTASEIVSSRPGTQPEGAVRWAREVLTPEIPWERELRGCVRRAVTYVAGSEDYTYTRPSRRQSVCPGIIFPSLRAPVPRVGCVIDTSASMNEAELEKAVSEVEGLLKALRCDVTVLSVDCEVHGYQKVVRSNQIVLKGGGGTDMGVGIHEIMERERGGVDILVIFTDGYTPWPETSPGVPVIVVLIESSDEYEEGSVGVPVWARSISVKAGGS